MSVARKHPPADNRWHSGRVVDHCIRGHSRSRLATGQSVGRTGSTSCGSPLGFRRASSRAQNLEPRARPLEETLRW